MSTKTIIACRPGMKQQMEAAFMGMTVVVDDQLTKDYEFREEAMSLDEILEAEVAKEERVDADPKQAHTFIVPMLPDDTLVLDDAWNLQYLAVRVADDASQVSVMSEIRKVKPTLTGSFPDEQVNVSATVSALKAHLKKQGFNVLSISVADGLVNLDH